MRDRLLAMAEERAFQEAHYPFGETPLVVAFAAVDSLGAVADGARVPLAIAPELSPDDAYLLLPSRAYAELLTAFARGAAGRVGAWFDEARVVRGEAVQGRHGSRVEVERAWRARDVIARRAAARVVELSGVGDPVRVINQLPVVSRLAPGGLFDRAGARAVASRGSYVGVSRVGVCELNLGADAVEPTFVWSEHEAGHAHVRVAVAGDDDALTALLAPLSLVL